jgi:outer membrane receptor protein involved in Fe transport
LNIPRQPLDAALKDLAKQTGLQIARFSDTPYGMTPVVGPVSGDMSVGQALTAILKKTGLTYRVVNDRTIAVVALGAGTAESASAAAGKQVTDLSAGSSGSGDSANNGQIAFWNTFLAAQADQGGSTSSVPENKQAPKQEPALQEILVTAQKRIERIQDVPVPVTAISADTLISNNQLLLRDMFSSFPSFSLGTSGAQGAQYLGIRGINTGNGNPSVGFIVDDAPYGSGTNQGGGTTIPDIDPNDLARVEVLRGPQGTLYGANSLGGLIKYVTVDPSTAGFSGHVQAGLSSVYNGAELGYNVRGSLNMPLSDTLAVRIGGFTRLDPGYIDNPVTGVDGVNETRVSGGRLSALWQPSEALSLKLSAMYQTARSNGVFDVDKLPELSGLQQNYILNTGGSDKSVQVYNATLTAHLGPVNLTSVTGYSVNTYEASTDATYYYGSYTLVQFGVTGSPQFYDYHDNNFSQEIRLSSSIGKNFEWLLGGFYTHQSSDMSQTISAQNDAGEIVGQWAYYTFPSTYQEIAGFTNLTWHFTERFDVQVGGRYSSFKQTAMQTAYGIPYWIGGPSPFVYPTAEMKNDAFTYLVTPRFVVSPDLMVYARFASGYRPGGPNFVFGNLPMEYDPDKTQNYEIGLKGDFLDHALSIDASVYYIKWKDLQLALYDPASVQGYIGNGSEAKSQGVELSVQSRPAKGLTIGGWVSFNDAVLTQDFPADSSYYGVSGDRLPLSSRWSANVSLDQQFPLVGRFDGFVGATASYVGDRLGPFQATAQRQDLPAYTKVDLRAGLKDDAWTVNLFATNITDERGVVQGGLGYDFPFAFVYIQPRTIGLSVARSF